MDSVQEMERKLKDGKPVVIAESREIEVDYRDDGTIWMREERFPEWRQVWERNLTPEELKDWPS